MGQDSRNYIIVGSFVVAVLAGLLVWIAFVSGRTGRTERYHIEYSSVMGLSAGTKILFQGFPVGLIENITRVQGDDGSRFRIDVSVKRDVPIPDDSVAEITASGLLAAVTIDIQEGSSTTLIQPGGKIPSRDPVSLFAAVTQLVDNEIRPLMARLYEGSDPIVQNVQEITEQLLRAAESVNQMLSQGNTQRVGRILENMERVTDEFATLTDGLDGVREDVDGLIGSVSRLVSENEDEIANSLQDVQHTLEAVARHIDAITSNLEVTTRNMSEFSQQIRENPAVMIRGRSQGDGATSN